MPDREMEQYRRERREDAWKAVRILASVSVVIIALVISYDISSWRAYDARCLVEHTHTSSVKAKGIDAAGYWRVYLEDGTEHGVASSSIGNAIRVGDLFTYTETHDKCKGEA